MFVVLAILAIGRITVPGVATTRCRSLALVHESLDRLPVTYTLKAVKTFGGRSRS